MRAPLNDAATFIRTLVLGYSFMATAPFEELGTKRQFELMEGVDAAAARLAAERHMVAAARHIVAACAANLQPCAAWL